MAGKPLRYGGRQWVTSEARQEVAVSIEDVAKENLKQAAKRDGVRVMTDPVVRWIEIWRLKMEHPELQATIPGFLRDEDWELRVWAYAEPA